MSVGARSPRGAGDAAFTGAGLAACATTAPRVSAFPVRSATRAGATA